MSNQTLEFICIILYLFAAGMQMLLLMGVLRRVKLVAMVVGWAAVLIHAQLLHQWIDIATGQNLNFFNVVSLVAWLNALIILLADIRKPVENLSVFTHPVAAISIILVLLFPGENVINTAANPKQLIHILLAVLAFSVLCVGAIQALLLAIQNRFLRSKQAVKVLQHLPPLETMESLLFQIIFLGFILLSVVLATGVLFFHDLFAPLLIQKTLLSMIAWVIFGILLVGRYRYGWRGNVAIRWTLLGFSMLVVSYFGSRLLVELLL